MTEHAPYSLPAGLAFVNGCELLKFLREQGTNRGPGVSDMLRYTGNRDGDPWCCSGISYIGGILLGPRWPVPRTAGCDVVLEWAYRRGVLHLPRRTVVAWSKKYPDRAARWEQLHAAPRLGDLFMTMAHPGDATHIGAVRLPNEDESFTTWEFNANGAGGREGNGCYSLTRNAPADKRVYALVRWEGLVR